MGMFTFFDRFRASGGDRSPWGDFFFEPVAARSTSGIRVSPDGALRLSAVYACVRILSETMASLPVVVYRQRKDGGKDRVTDHWLYALLARKPNRFQNPFEWREMLQGHLSLRGNAFCQIISNPKGEITELMPIHPDRVRMEVMDSGDFRYRVRMQSGDETVFPRGQIWHLRGLSSDGLMGMSPIELARESLGMALAAQDYGARFFTNDAKPTGGWIEFPGTFKDAEAKRVFRDSYQSAQAGSNRGKVLVLENGMKFHEVGVTNKDAQFLELRKFQITDIARMFRVPQNPKTPNYFFVNYIINYKSSVKAIRFNIYFLILNSTKSWDPFDNSRNGIWTNYFFTVAWKSSCSGFIKLLSKIVNTLHIKL